METLDKIGILIVEDVPEMGELIGQTLGPIEGFVVLGIAHNTLEARNLISKNRPSLVLLDEILPGESSYDLLLELKRDEIPTLLITGVGEPTHPIPPEALGRLAKPSWEGMKGDRKRFEEEIRKLL